MKVSHDLKFYNCFFLCKLGVIWYWLFFFLKDYKISRVDLDFVRSINIKNFNFFIYLIFIALKIINIFVHFYSCQFEIMFLFLEFVHINVFYSIGFLKLYQSSSSLLDSFHCTFKTYWKYSIDIVVSYFIV